MIHQHSYAHVVTVQRPRGRFPTRFAALEALLATLRPGSGQAVTIEREAIPTDSGLDAISVFSDTGDDQFLILRINADTFTITRKPRVA